MAEAFRVETVQIEGVLVAEDLGVEIIIQIEVAFEAGVIQIEVVSGAEDPIDSLSPMNNIISSV